MLGDLTEEVADHMGDTVGGLLNASFGNAVEMVIGVQVRTWGECGEKARSGFVCMYWWDGV